MPISAGTEVERLRAALKRLHDECSILKHGTWLNMGPMMEPSEAAVLEARALLSEAPASPPGWEAKLRALEHNWDTYDGVPITEAAIAAAKTVSIVPLSDGGLQFEWGDQEIVIGPDGKPGIAVE